MGVFAGDAADRERVPAIGRDIDLDGEVVEAQQRHGFGADHGIETEAREQQDAVVLLTHAELAGRRHHPVGHVAVGLSRGDGKRPREHRARKRDDDLVTHGEVVRSADDAPGFDLADIHLAPVDGLAV